jgi:hypothetical protein
MALIEYYPGYLAIGDISFVSAAANDMTALTSKNQYYQALKVFQHLAIIVKHGGLRRQVRLNSI